MLKVIKIVNYKQFLRIQQTALLQIVFQIMHKTTLDLIKFNYKN